MQQQCCESKAMQSLQQHVAMLIAGSVDIGSAVATLWRQWRCQSMAVVLRVSVSDEAVVSVDGSRECCSRRSTRLSVSVEAAAAVVSVEGAAVVEHLDAALRTVGSVDSGSDGTTIVGRSSQHQWQCGQWIGWHHGCRCWWSWQWCQSSAFGGCFIRHNA